jgi:predicted extracellular nuclease
MKKIYLFTSMLFLFIGLSSNAQVVISQVYGGGGNSGAPLNRDFIELFNRGTAAVDVSGYTIQYNSATGTGAWLFNTIPAGAIIQPGKYYLHLEQQVQTELLCQQRILILQQLVF